MSNVEPDATISVRDPLILGFPSTQSAGGDAPRWSLATRLAFRFCFLYLGLFLVLEFLTIPEWMLLNPIPSARIAIGDLPPFRNLVFWAAEHIFHLAKPRAPFVYETNGTLWIQVFCILVVAIPGTVLWSILDRRRVSYPKLHAWFRVVVLVWLGATMFFYGTGKVVPVQMWFPRLSRLLERFGDFSPMAVLWNSIGASHGYEFFTGFAEILGGMFLFIPRTALLGALICAADMSNVFILNMTYDVNVKGLSLHALLMAAFLLAADARPLTNLFLLNRAAQPSFRLSLFRGAHPNQMAQAVILLVGVILLGGGLNSAVRRYRTEVAEPPPPLYGIWTVEDFLLDGQSRPPLVTDDVRWRRVVFENVHPWARREEIFQRGKFANAADVSVYGMDDEPKPDDGALAVVNIRAGTIDWFTSPDQSELLSYAQPAAGELVLDGVLKGHKIHARLKLFDTSNFYLVTHANKLNWVGSGSDR